MGNIYREKAFHSGKKIRKNDFAPSEKYSSYAPVYFSCLDFLFCLNFVQKETMVCILERGITLVYPYSRNKSDQKDKFTFFFLFFKQNGEGNSIELVMTSALNTTPKLIHRSELVKLTCKTKDQKSSPHSQTYSFTIVIPLSRIRTYVITHSTHPLNYP